MLVDERVDLVVEEPAHGLGQVLVVEDLVAFGVDRLALLVDDVVELDDALADVEVEALDARLGAFDRARHHLRFDGDVLVEPEPLHEPRDTIGGEALHQVVVERQVEARRTRIALAAGAATQLVVDAARVVAFRADDVQAARFDDADVLLLGQRLGLGQRRRVGLLVHLGRVEALLVEGLRRQAGGVAAEQDVRAAAGHVRGDRHGTGAPGLRDDARLLLVELGVEGLVLDAAALEHRREDLGLLDADRSHEHGPAFLLELDDLVDQGVELRPLVAEHEVRVVGADHVAVGRDGHDLEVVDLVELLGLGHRGAGHARQLVVQAEVVLERDRGERDGLALDPQAFLRLDRLVEALAPAPAGHLAAGELVDDDDLAVLDDVVAVALVQRVGPQRLLEVAGHPRIGVVQVLDAEQLLHLVDALFGRADGPILEVDEVVAALLGALGALLETRHQAGEGEVQVRGLLGLARDDQRRARLVDEDVVDLVDDREAALALDPLVELDDHVVPEVVEPELVVRAVRDVGGIGLAAGHGPQVDQALVAGREARLEHERRVVRDHPDADAQEVVDGSHPLRVAPGEVVVDGHDVHAAAGEGVEDRGQGRHEGLALAGPHLGDLALVEHGAADQLDVEVAHAERALHGLAGHREDLGHDVVEGFLEALVLALAALLAQLAAAFEVLVVQLVLGRLIRGGLRVDLFADLGELRADLLFGQRLEFGFERVRLVDHRLDPSDLAVVRVDETGKESHGAMSIRSDRPKPPRGAAAVARSRTRCRTPRSGSGTSARRGRARTGRT